MTIFTSRISRRAVLSATAGLAVTPSLAAECQIGPPPHQKGPIVWGDMDQVELDSSYDQQVYAPLRAQIGARRAANSELVRQTHGEPLRFSYGPSANEKLEVYRTNRPKASVFVFVHGGAWLGGEAKDYADSAEHLIDLGAHYVAIDFLPIKEAGGDLRIMTDQVRGAIAWAYKNVDKFGGDPNQFYIGGHSSGGHLAGLALITDWQKDFGLSTDFIKGGLLMSGMYDMKPVRLSKRSDYVKFDDDMEQQMSAMRYLDRLHTPVIVSTGSFETPDFQRQSIEFATALKSSGKPVTLIQAKGYNHFEMGESLGHPYGPNGRAVKEMMNL